MNLTRIINDRKQRQSCRFTMFQEIKSLYPCVIYPNKTFYNTNMTGIRRFTPDGKYLICIGPRVISLYIYLGPVPKQGPTDDFAKFFTLKYEKSLTIGNEIICKDFSLFSQDQKWMILASAVSSDSLHSSLDDITFWIMDIESGQILGSKTFLNDYIFLNNNSGVHLFKNYLAIASVQKQAIYICHLRMDGSLILAQTIGPNLFEDDEMILAEATRVRKYTDQEHEDKRQRIEVEEVPTDSRKKRPFSGLMQRILTFLFKKAKGTGKKFSLNHFNMTFGHFESLLLWKVLFIDEYRLFIKMGNSENIMGKSAESSITHTSFFVIYNYKTATVENMFDNSSQELLEFCQSIPLLIGNIPDESFLFISGPENNIHAMEIMKSHIFAVQKARNGGAAQAVKRLVSGCPHNPQSFYSTPYFDHNLFSWDDKLINAYDRARPCSEFPVKFFSRKTGKLKFKIDPHMIPYGSNPNSPPYRSSKKYVYYVFHPTDPFCFSIQHTPTQQIVNIHYRDPLL